MTSTIFISYSRHDQHEAFAVRDLLRKEGFTVWIDQEAIEAATQWSAEIVENIKSCDVFIILLSHASASSHNVSKELSLASENRKIIFPIELESVSLPSTLEYALAGIQKVQYKDKEAIIRGIRRHITENINSAIGTVTKRSFFLRYKFPILALSVVVIALLFFLIKNSGKPEVKNDQKTIIAVLPFSVYNSDQDSVATLDVFSEGIMTQLLAQKIFLLKNRSQVAEYSNSDLRPTVIAKKLDSRFIIDGTVRKIDDRLKVSARLYDVTTGIDIWSKEYSGSMRQLLSIRDTLAIEIVAFANELLTHEREIAADEKGVRDHPNDPDAYHKLSIQYEFSNKLKSIELMEKSLALDPSRSFGYVYLAQMYSMLNNPSKSREFAAKGKPVFEKDIREHPLDLFLKTRYASLFFYSGDPDQAVAYLINVLKQAGRSKEQAIGISLCFYSISCFLSQQNKTELSLDNLDSSMKYNTSYDKQTFMESDPDLDNIRNLPRYRKIVYGK